MSEIVRTSSRAIVPQSRVPFSVRPATLADVPFMDSMQKKFGKQLGYFPTKQFEGYVEMGGVLIAEERSSADCADGRRLNPNLRESAQSADQSSPIGYVISRDRYLKRDELGVIYQLCVAPGTQRKLLGASLIAEVFRRSAYGCKLYCCWCAQDIEANYFWESIGFVPIAFRAGSAKKKRVHIFWQRRVHVEDPGEKMTPYWYPSNTTGGAIAQDRLVFPIPPGVHWKDVQAIALPGSVESAVLAQPKRLRGEKRAKKLAEVVLPKSEIRSGGLRVTSAPAALPAPVAKKEAAPRQPKVKADPALVAKARELRDRWLEHVNADPSGLIGAGKYEVARQLPEATGDQRGRDAKLLDAA